MNSGINPYDVKTMARHINIQTTLDSYASAELERIGNEVNSKVTF